MDAAVAPPAGLLIDIDGVLTVSWEPIAGAIDAFAVLQERGIPYRLATNTTSRTRDDVAAALVAAGFPVGADEILTAPVATASYLRETHPGAPVFLLSSGDLVGDLEGIDVVGEDADADVVVLGGAGLVYTHEQLNRAFNLILGGAAFVAMHRNLYWRTGRGMELDTGAYALALEAATGVSPVVLGKPSPEFFAAGVAALGVDAGAVMMIGDDVVNDVGGAQECGLRGCLVRTGKYRTDAVAASGVTPDHVIDSFADLVREGILH